MNLSITLFTSRFGCVIASRKAFLFFNQRNFIWCVGLVRYVIMNHKSLYFIRLVLGSIALIWAGKYGRA